MADLLAYNVDDAVVCWVRADPSEIERSRRDVISAGNNLVALLEPADEWLPKIASILDKKALQPLRSDELADQLKPHLTNLIKKARDPLRLIVGGRSTTGAPMLFLLHSGAEFAPIPLASYNGGDAPEAIWNYFLSVLTSIPATFDNVIDLLLLIGDVYCAMFGYAKACQVAVVRNGTPLIWSSDEDIHDRLKRNNHRLAIFQSHLTRHFMARVALR